MAIFIGGSKNTSAVRCGLKINGAVCEIINPLLKSVYTNEVFTVKHNVGVDTSQISVSRIGVKGDNDLVWVGRAANYAAKLTELPSDYPVSITKEVFDNMNDSVKFCSGNYIWEKASWTSMSGMEIYRTHWFYYVK
jgi:class 3 adenylate cyclase